MAENGSEKMRLFWSSRSPYVRYVTVVAHECGLFGQLELERVAVSPTRHHEEVSRHNPLGKIPTLVQPDGRSIIDSKVISRFLDQRSARPGHLVRTGDAQWEVARIEAIAIGLADLAIAHLIEEFRLNGAPPPPHVLAMRERVAHILDALDQLAPTLDASDPHLGELALAVVLKYLDFRPGVAPEWRTGRERLGAWLGQIEQRRSIQATEFELVI